MDELVDKRRRGRPRKFGSPSRPVALTLPDDVVGGLRGIHQDLARAIVSLFEKHPPPGGLKPLADFELLRIAERRSLIVVNRACFTHLPGVDIVPVSAEHAFLALAADRGLSDLELAVIDRLDEPSLTDAERATLSAFRVQLQQWRTNGALTFRTRAIIVVEQHESTPGPKATSPQRRRPTPL